MSDLMANETVAQEDIPIQRVTLSLEELELIDELNGALQQAEDAKSPILAEIEEIISHYLRKAIATNTSWDIYQAILPYLEDQNTQSLLNVLSVEDDTVFSEQIQENVDTAIGCQLRRLRALYGKELREALEIGGQDDASWRDMQRYLYHDSISGRWNVSLDITKYNGEQIHLLEAPESALRLVHGIVDTLNQMPEEDAPAQMASDTVENFMGACWQLLSLYAPSLLEEEPELALAEDLVEGPVPAL